jgi:glyoxylase-like metal-dependent hydrolase (beta-lactamase superfamily II)
MKHLFSLFTLFAITMSATTALFAQNFRIVALDESPGRSMNAGLFTSADPETIKKYMPDGNAPASMSSFVLFAGEDTILFDTATGSETWVKKLTEHGVKPESVKLILLTHFHGDHIGGLLQGDTRRFPNAKVLSSTQEYEAGLRQPPIVKIQSVYGKDFTTFKFDDEVFANTVVKVKALDAMGHTPGHAVFLIELKPENKAKVLIIGDLLHAAALQFPAPEACASFDSDKGKAVASRKRILDFAAQENILVGGMHLPPPSIGTVKKEDKGYSFGLKK